MRARVTLAGPLRLSPADRGYLKLVEVNCHLNSSQLAPSYPVAPALLCAAQIQPKEPYIIFPFSIHVQNPPAKGRPADAQPSSHSAGQSKAVVIGDHDTYDLAESVKPRETVFV